MFFVYYIIFGNFFVFNIIFGIFLGFTLFSVFDIILMFFRYCLLKTLVKIQISIEFTESIGKEVKWHGRTKEEVAHYCNDCEVRTLIHI